MRLSGVRAWGGLLLGLAAALAPAAAAADPPACRAVRFADIGWVDVSATTAVAARILRDLGYQPRISDLPIAATYQGLKAGTVDAFLGNWMPAMAAERKPYLDDKSIDVLGPNLEGAKFTLAVPQYTWDKGLHDFQDIQKFGQELDWKIYGIEPGNDGNRHILDLIHAKRWGLEKFQLVEGSEQSMLAQLAKDYRAHRPIVFLGWEPHPMNIRYKIAYLTGGDDTFGPDFGAESVYTNIRAGYATECPNVAKFLGNLKFTLTAEDTLMADILDRRMDPERAARTWLRGNRDVLPDWLEDVTTFDGRPGLRVVQARR